MNPALEQAGRRYLARSGDHKGLRRGSGSLGGLSCWSSPRLPLSRGNGCSGGAVLAGWQQMCALDRD